MNGFITTSALGILLIPGMLTAQENLSLRDNDSLQVNTLEEVVITGQYEPKSIRNSVFKIRTISSEQIQLRGSVTVENILNTQLGIRFFNDLVLGESDIELMGMSGQNVKVLIDGVPLLDRGESRQSLSQVDVNNIDRIEIVEGPMSVSYGTDALAGVINIITKGPQKADNVTLSARFQEESAGNEYAFLTNEGIHNSNVTLDWVRKGIQVKGSASRNNSGGWRGNQQGRALEWNPKDQWLASGTVGFANNRSHTWYRLDFLDEDILYPSPMAPNYTAADKNFITRRFTHLLQSQWQLSKNLSFNGSASYQNYTRNTNTTEYDFRDGTSQPSNATGAQDTVKFNLTLLRGSLQYKLSDRVHLQPGFEIRSDEGNGQRIEGRPRITDYAVFLSAELKPLLWMNIRPGLRFTSNSVYDAPPIIPSISTQFKINEQADIRFAYARGFRAPALRELYFTFFDANHSIRGNQDLQAEFSNSYNANITWYAFNLGQAQLTSTAGGFYNDFRNRIDVGLDPNDARVNTYVNINKYRTAGGTFENKLIWKQLTADIGFSYIGRYSELSESEENVPSMTWYPEINGNLFYHIPKWQSSINLFYKFSGTRPSYQALFNTDGSTSIYRAVTGSYHMADLTLSKQFTSYLTFNGGVRNLFDVTRIDNTSQATGEAHSEAGAPVPVSYGRSFFLGINFTWSKY